MIKKVIVIGGSGFLGYHIIKALQKSRNLHVTCGDLVKSELLDCEFVYFNILNRKKSHSILSNYDTVINCTGQVTKPINLCFRLNSEGILNLSLNNSKKSFRLIHISTVSVYGTVKFCDEKSTLNPETTYAMAKAFSEKILSENFKARQLVILRLPNLYGFKQEKGLFSYLLKSYRSNQKLQFNNNGALIRSYIHAEDCSEIISKIVSNRKIKGTFNIEGNETFSIKNLIKKIENKFNIIFEKEFNNDDPWENIETLDGSSLKSLIDYNYNWSLLEFFKKEIKKN